jgi:MFS family permease
MMDHLPAKITVMSGVLAYFCSTVCLIFAQSYWLLSVAAALVGLGFGGMVPVRSVILSRLFGVDKFSRVNGLLSFFLAPATFWVLITGYIADTSQTYVTAFYIWSVAFVLAGVVSMLVNLPDRDVVS